MLSINLRTLLIVFLSFILNSCGDSSVFDNSKDYYPVSQWDDGTIYHWGKNNIIKIHINSDNTDLTSIEESNYITSFKAGITEWEETLSSIGIKIEYVTSNADVNIKWVSGSTLAKGVMGYASTNKIITMSRTNNLYESDSYHSDTTIKKIAIHEFGHMLGIWTHSFDSNDIMYPYITGNTAKLSNRDKKTVTDFLYSLTPNKDMHDLSGPAISRDLSTQVNQATTYFTSNGCFIELSPKRKNLYSKSFSMGN